MDDHGLYYETTGAGRPLVLLHAGVADSRMWDDQAAAFARRYRLIRYDLPGSGRSPIPNRRFSHHGILHALFESIGLEPAWLVGASFGGRVAVDFCLAYPEKVRGMVLAGPVLGGFQPSAEIERFGEEEDRLLEAGDLEAATELNLRTWVDGPRRSADQVDPAVRALVGEMQLQAFSMPVPDNAELEWLEPPAMERLDEIQVPTLVVVGAQDIQEVIMHGAKVSSEISTADIRVMPTSGHLMSMEAPDEFNRLVLSFMAEHEEVSISPEPHHDV
jgi:pimeloyl-ACP methyl ester carboxylesterase